MLLGDLPWVDIDAVTERSLRLLYLFFRVRQPTVKSLSITGTYWTTSHLILAIHLIHLKETDVSLLFSQIF